MILIDQPWINLLENVKTVILGGDISVIDLIKAHETERAADILKFVGGVVRVEEGKEVQVVAVGQVPDTLGI